MCHLGIIYHLFFKTHAKLASCLQIFRNAIAGTDVFCPDIALALLLWLKPAIITQGQNPCKFLKVANGNIFNFIQRLCSVSSSQVKISKLYQSLGDISRILAGTGKKMNMPNDYSWGLSQNFLFSGHFYQCHIG